MSTAPLPGWVWPVTAGDEPASLVSKPCAAATSRSCPAPVVPVSSVAVGGATTLSVASATELGKYVQLSRPLASPKAPVQLAFVLTVPDVMPYARWVLALS